MSEGAKYVVLPDGQYAPAMAVYGSDGIESGVALTPYHLVSAASTNAHLVDATARRLGYIAAYNLNAAARYLKVYDKATTPTVGTDTPILTLMLPGNTAGAGSNLPLPDGIALTNGLGIAITTGIADTDTGAVAANEIVVNLGWC